MFASQALWRVRTSRVQNWGNMFFFDIQSLHSKYISVQLLNSYCFCNTQSPVRGFLPLPVPGSVIFSAAVCKNRSQDFSVLRCDSVAAAVPCVREPKWPVVSLGGVGEGLCCLEWSVPHVWSVLLSSAFAEERRISDGRWNSKNLRW